jgi:hypothetical protein
MGFGPVLAVVRDPVIVFDRFLPVGLFTGPLGPAMARMGIVFKFSELHSSGATGPETVTIAISAVVFLPIHHNLFS